MNKNQYQKLLQATSKKAQIYAKFNIGIAEPATRWTDQQINPIMEKISSGEYERDRQKGELKYGYAAAFNPYAQVTPKPVPRDIVFHLSEILMKNTLSHSGALLDLALDFTDQAFEKVINNEAGDYSNTIKLLLKSIKHNSAVMDALKLDEAMLEKHFLDAHLSNTPAFSAGLDDGDDNGASANQPLKTSNSVSKI